MAFEFNRKESLTQAFQRIAQSQVKDARETLNHCGQLDAVHEIRKNIKKLRSLLRLLRIGVDRKAYRRCTTTLRESARLLGPPRDAHVKVNALRDLIIHFRQQLSSRPFSHTKRMLVGDCQAARRLLSERRAKKKLAPLLQDFSKETRALKIRPSGWATLGPGVKRGYRAGRRGYRLALRENTPEAFHEWRKQVKSLLYQTHLLCHIWPEQMSAAEAELKELGQRLGDDHDLFLLTEPKLLKRIRKGDGEEAETLKALVTLRQQELRSQALALGARFYQEKPAAFCKRLAGYWKRWRHGPKRARISRGAD